MLSPALVRIDDYKLPKTVLKIVGEFAGTDHTFRKGDHYFTVDTGTTYIQLGQIGVPFFTKFLVSESIHEWHVNRATPCSVDVTYVRTHHILDISGKRYNLQENEEIPNKKIMVCRRKDFTLQSELRQLVYQTEVVQWNSIYDRSSRHAVFILDEEQYEKVGLGHSWVHNIIMAGIAMDMLHVEQGELFAM